MAVQMARRGPTASARRLIAPAAAAAVGYTSKVFDDDFLDINTIDFTGNAVAGSGKKWTNRQPFDGAGATVTAANTSVANSILTLAQNRDNWNQGLWTTNGPLGSHLAGPFQYGYFEAKIKFDAFAVVAPGNPGGWPSFWSIGATHVLLTQTTRWPELDFFEFAYDRSKTSGGVGAFSIHDHDGRSGTEVDHWNVPYNTVNLNPATWNDWHLYGCLWQPGSVKWYFDGVLISTQTYSSTAQNPAASNGNPAGTYSQFDDPTHGPMTMSLGTGVAAPMLVDWVRVWQAPASGAPSLLTGNLISLGDQSLESGIGNWDTGPYGGEARAVSVSTVQKRDGNSSLRMQRSAAGTSWIATWGALVPTSPGQTFAPYAWFYTTDSGLSAGVNIEVKLNGGYVTGSYMEGQATSLTPGVWTKVTAPAYTAPTGINQFQPMFQIFGATAAGQGAYIDTIYYGA